MSIYKKIIEKLLKSIKKGDDKKMISEYEDLLRSSFSEISNLPYFYQLPFENIVSIINPINFVDIQDPATVIRNIVKYSTQQYPDKSILLLNSIHCAECSTIKESEIISIFQEFVNIDLCKLLVEALNPAFVVPDYDYEIEIKNKEISKLKDEIEQLKVSDCMSNILEAFNQGKIPSDQFNTLRGQLISIAIITDNQKLVEYYIEKLHCHPDLRNDENDTILHNACANGHLDIVKYLLEKQHVDINARGFNERLPITYACLNGHLPIVKYLIEEQHVDKYIKGKYGRTPLHWACEAGQFNLAKYLIENQNVDKYIRDDDNKTPLHSLCAFSDNTKLLHYLINEQHVDKETLGPNNNTPFLLACEFGNLPIVKTLIEYYHVNIYAKNSDGQTAIQLAQRNSYQDVINYLRRYGL